jgi:hypothetical protein
MRGPSFAGRHSMLAPAELRDKAEIMRVLAPDETDTHASDAYCAMADAYDVMAEQHEFTRKHVVRCAKIGVVKTVREPPVNRRQLCVARVAAERVISEDDLLAASVERISRRFQQDDITKRQD